jgi:hypothetical protein
LHQRFVAVANNIFTTVFKNSMRTFFSGTSINCLDNGIQFPIWQDRTISLRLSAKSVLVKHWIGGYHFFLQTLCETAAEITAVSQPQEGRLGRRQRRKIAVRTRDKFGAKQKLIHVGFMDVTRSRQNLCAFEVTLLPDFDVVVLISRWSGNAL